MFEKFTNSISEFFTSSGSTDGAVAAGESQQGSALMSMLPLILIIAVFYFLIIRPQQRKLKDHQKMVQNITKGDEVITSGGIVGKVAKIEDDIALIEIAPNVTIKVKKEMLIYVEPKNSKHDVTASKSHKDDEVGKKGGKNLKDHGKAHNNKHNKK